MIPSEVFLESVDQRVTVHRSGLVGQWRQVSRFSSFSSPNLRQFADPENWQDVAVEVVVVALQPGLVRQLWGLARSPGGNSLFTMEAMQRYEVPPRMRVESYKIVGLPCSASMQLLINERRVAMSAAAVVQVREFPDDERGLVVVKFPVVSAIPNALPRYAATPPRAASDRPASR